MLGNRIRFYRLTEHYSLKEVADKFNYNRSKIKKWECGEETPTDEELTKLAEILEIEKKELLLDVSEKGKFIWVKNVIETESARVWMYIISFCLCVIGISLALGSVVLNSRLKSYASTITNLSSKEDYESVTKLIGVANQINSIFILVGIILCSISILLIIVCFFVKHIKYVKKEVKM